MRVTWPIRDFTSCHIWGQPDPCHITVYSDGYVVCPPEHGGWGAYIVWVNAKQAYQLEFGRNGPPPAPVGVWLDVKHASGLIDWHTEAAANLKYHLDRRTNLG